MMLSFLRKIRAPRPPDASGRVQTVSAKTKKKKEEEKENKKDEEKEEEEN